MTRSGPSRALRPDRADRRDLQLRFPPTHPCQALSQATVTKTLTVSAHGRYLYCCIGLELGNVTCGNQGLVTLPVVTRAVMGQCCSFRYKLYSRRKSQKSHRLEQIPKCIFLRSRCILPPVYICAPVIYPFEFNTIFANFKSSTFESPSNYTMCLNQTAYVYNHPSMLKLRL